MRPPLPRRLDLTRPRPGQRLHRSLTLTPAADGGAQLAVHIGRACMAVNLSTDDLWQLIGMVTDVQFAHGIAGEVTA